MIYGASILALFASLLLMPVLGRILWLGTQNVWVFIVLFAVFYSLFYGLIDRMSWLKRLFVTKRQVEIEVQKAAMTHFFAERLYRTKDANGILLFISIFEHQAWVLADSGINACIDQRQWQAVIDHVTEGIKRGQPGEAICEAIVMIGDLLKTHFPIQVNDNNELHDNIILST
jgi:putative membrane protein